MWVIKYETNIIQSTRNWRLHKMWCWVIGTKGNHINTKYIISDREKTWLVHNLFSELKWAFLPKISENDPNSLISTTDLIFTCVERLPQIHFYDKNSTARALKSKRWLFVMKMKVLFSLLPHVKKGKQTFWEQQTSLLYNIKCTNKWNIVILVKGQVELNNIQLSGLSSIQ